MSQPGRYRNVPPQRRRITPPTPIPPPPPVQPPAPRLSGDPNYSGRHRSADWPADTGLLPSQPEQEGSSPLSSYVVSHLRTLVPAAWGALIAYLTERYVPGLPAEVATDPTILAVVTSVATVAWYALWRAVEPRVPRAIIAVVLGHPAEPSYPD